jgi:hypothetical protein
MYICTYSSQMIKLIDGDGKGERDEMTSKIGVLLTSKESGEQVAVIEFEPDGMLINSMIKPGLHVYALRSVMNLLGEKGFQPLYIKHKALKDEAGNLPREVLREEAESCSKILNDAEVTVGGIPVNASMVEWQVPYK